ncbi:MAG: hypothetical protein HRU00_17170 [Myxococcales bacterium]|nr:hypothetical protein [Myxococcales bacterium]
MTIALEVVAEAYPNTFVSRVVEWSERTSIVAVVLRGGRSLIVDTDTKQMWPPRSGP